MRLSVLALLLLFSSPLAAQTLGSQRALPLAAAGRPLVIVEGDTLALPFAGGLNSAQLSAFDYDGDGLDDLLIFDRTDQRSRLYLREHAPGQVAYTTSQNFRLPLPQRPRNYLIAKDLDGDGSPELIADSLSSFVIYKRQGTGYNASYSRWLPFLMARRVSGGDTTTIAVGRNTTDIPCWADVDGDGDIDLLMPEPFAGEQILLYRNRAQEDLGRTDTLDLWLESRCYGQFRYDINPDTTGLIAELDFFCSGTATPSTNKVNHAGGAVLATDLNDDGLMDLLVSDSDVPYAMALINGGTARDAYMTSYVPAFPAHQPFDVANFPAFFEVDLTQDGLPELIAAPNDPLGGRDYDGVQAARNNGLGGMPRYGHPHNMLQGQMLDHGTGAFPCLVDVDNDGVKDLLLCSADGYNGKGGGHSHGDGDGDGHGDGHGHTGTPSTTNGGHGGRKANFYLYLNRGTNSAPVWELVPHDPIHDPIHQRVHLTGVGLFNFAPTAGDLDGDGDEDILIGTHDPLGGSPLLLLRNVGTAGSPTYEADWNYLNLSTDGASYWAPHLVDLDLDGDLDLLLGTGSGSIHLYENTGNRRSAAFTLRTRNWLGINVTQPADFGLGRAVPFVLDLAGDGTLDLLVGTNSDGMRIYENVSLSGSTASFSEYLIAPDQAAQASIAAFTADAASDKLVLLVGNRLGGLLGYETEGQLLVPAAPQLSDASNYWLYPNPVQDQLTLEFPIATRVEIYAVDGRQLWAYTSTGAALTALEASEPIIEKLALNVSAYPAGLYIVRFTNGSTVVSRRFIKQ